ncbi:Rieske 2Fe-2S domain-containing protein [Myxosarcina sp. GI1]|uniref:aromatic ring-hydroxylating dioxygenase subunit alpha n=1 Tax=Myxosarcina sp. GI1 TaxID=1541065 RepID=UPI0005650B7D|nr:Rieske 2Fe-2S domain-containing protein [Myxosarcina sp. GI1]
MTTTAIASTNNQLLPGGDESTVFDPKEAWYPIYYLEDLDKSKLAIFTLLETNLVIWWDKSANSWRVFEDRCPHRLAPLSEGRVNERGLLECPYHGWAFAGSGECKFIPQQPETEKRTISSRACATSLPVAIAQGLLFVYPGTPERAEKTPVPIVPPLEEAADEWVCLDTFRDLPYDALTLLENVIDASHIPFTHHKTVSDRANAAAIDLKITESGKHGFRGVWEEGPRKGTLGTQYTTFVAPGLMWHDLTSKKFGRTMTVVYATPISKGKCRLFARFPFKFASPFPRFFIKLSPRWYSHLNQNGVLEDDQIFLHYQERYLAASGGSDNFAKAFYLPTKADLYVSELRQWVNYYHADPFPDAQFSAPLSKEQLLDRFSSHTASCVSCRQALKNIHKLRTIAAAVAILIWAIIPLSLVSLESIPVWSAIGLTSLVLFSSFTWWRLGKLEQRFYRGKDIPPRNLPAK